MLDAVVWQMDHLHEIPALVVACFDYPEKVEGMAVYRSAGSVWPGIQNLLLTARSLGLGAAPTTLALRDQDAVREILQLPETFAALCLIPVGYPTGNFGPHASKHFMPANLRDLLTTLPQSGRLEWIGVRPARRVAMLATESVVANTESGLQGDRFAARSTTRQVTLIQAEHLPVIASCLARDSIEPELLRRNLVVSGLNLLALKDQIFRIGVVELKTTGLCHPCSRMEQILGPGGYNAVRGHGGITAQVISNGNLAIGDTVSLI